jgi:hypothetical protein
MYWIHHLGGFTALALVNAALLAFAFWLLYRSSEGPEWMRVTAIVIGAWAARPGFALRPNTITFVMGAAFLFVARQYLRDGRALRLAWLPVLTVVWVQMHAGYYLGPALLLAVATAELIDSLARRSQVERSRLARLVIAAAACVAVVPLNPNGAAMWRYPFAVLTMKSNRFIAEWQAPQLERSLFYPFISLALLTLLAMMFSRERYRPGQFLMFAAVLAMALRSGRNIPIFVLIAAPLLAEHARVAWARKFCSKSARSRRAWAYGVVATCAVGCVMQTKAAIEFHRDAESALYPKAAVDYLVEHNLKPNLLNDYAYGGYLIWRLDSENHAPAYKVLIDGRADLYGDAFVLPYFDIYMGFENPEPLLTNAKINTVLLSPNCGLAGLFRIKTGNDSWQLIYEDRRAVIFARKKPVDARP